MESALTGNANLLVNLAMVMVVSTGGRRVNVRIVVAVDYANIRDKRASVETVAVEDFVNTGRESRNVRNAVGAASARMGARRIAARIAEEVGSVVNTGIGMKIAKLTFLEGQSVRNVEEATSAYTDG
jgi:hypothetical protein